jgi:chemotaxis protein CheX
MEAVKERTTGGELVVPFVNSARTVLSTMAGINAVIEKPFLKNGAVLKHDISGIIGFTGEIEGSVVIGLSMGVARYVVKAFAGMELTIESPDFADAIGELANMIAGSAKQHLNATAGISIPTVVLGNGHVTARLNGVPCVVIPCKTPAGDFAVEVNIRYAKPR